MKYFTIETIRDSINQLKGVSANWLIPAFVFAANDVGLVEYVDMSKAKGTDQFLDNYFFGSLIGLPSFSSGNNLMRPILKGVKVEHKGDLVVRQNTKMWGNLFSSRGYREMRQRGEIEAENSNVRLTDNFKSSFEREIAPEFEFEDLLTWLFAFNGFPDEVSSWQDLLKFLLKELDLEDFKPAYRGRFKLTSGRSWPPTLSERPTNAEFQQALAPGLLIELNKQAPAQKTEEENDHKLGPELPGDDAVLSLVQSAIDRRLSLSFLLAGPPGTGKTYYAHSLAASLANGQHDRILSLQFHPAFGYDDFVEGFRPVEVRNHEDEVTGVAYKLDDRHILKFAKKARERPGDTFVLVIDELNRGDVARIFGELLTYLEVDYRNKNFTLAVSGETMSLPENLVIIATANPFDRSVTDLDDALLRRFIVVPMEPDKVFLEAYLQKTGVPNLVIRRVLHLFDMLNEILPVGFGHTSFLKVRSLEDLADVWTGRVQLGVTRTLFHEKQKLKKFKEDVDQLLKVNEEQEALSDPADNQVFAESGVLEVVPESQVQQPGA
ncbi:AAA family ATPase [Xanthomonas translucens pv. translucens]|uniref:McrB family protein n=1 Tax=Xanthomonas campestris pv. translucens TaxID=343 RepID=UPI0021B78E0B|nr:AAA family ATPase [Xanthomonas translucens]MCT8284934.1 AAA family ATPase [Xanthomonas translucens pv. translucens]MCT8302592.1 AAA family ATPase [Xanthomonas translucens pv. translucens]